MYDEIDAPEFAYLTIATSQLPNSGNGLITSININKDEIIALFKGEILGDDQAKLRAEKGQDQYFINLLDGSILDSKKIKCFAKYANDADGFSISYPKTPGFKNNAKIGLNDDKKVCLIATRNIKSGEEIFCSYGKRYWKKHSLN